MLIFWCHEAQWTVICNLQSYLFISAANYSSATVISPTPGIIIHHTHYENSDWSRAFNQFTIACEPDMINAISAAVIAFIMSSLTSAWLLSPLECSQKQNGWTLRFCFWGWIMWKMCNKTIIEFGFRMISWIIKISCLCYLPQPSASADNTHLGFDNSWDHAQPHPIIVYYNVAINSFCSPARTLIDFKALSAPKPSFFI